MPGAGLEPARPCGQGIFLPAMAFATPAYATRFAVWTLSLPCRQKRRCRQRLSSLYTFPGAKQEPQPGHHSEGLARYWHQPPHWSAFTEFKRIQTRSFLSSCSTSCKSLASTIPPSRPYLFVQITIYNL